MRSYWEKAIYVVKTQIAESPVYVVCSENGDQQKTRTLHRNLLLLVNDLPVEMTPPKPRPVPTKNTSNRQRQGRVPDTQEQAEMTDNTDSDSEEENSGGYWLRIPAESTEKRPEQHTWDPRDPAGNLLVKKIMLYLNRVETQREKAQMETYLS